MQLTNGFAKGVETHVIDGASVAWQLVQELPCSRLPDGHALIPATSCNLFAFKVPARLQEVALLASRGPIVRLYASVSGSKGPYIPCPDSRIVCV